MGAHHRNPNAVAKAARPAGGMGQIQVQLGTQQRLKPHILVLPQERIRTAGEGQTEIQDAKGVWGPLPEGMMAVADTASGMEYFDMVVGLIAIAQSGVAGVDGRPVGRARWLVDLYREDARAFIEAMEPPKSQPQPVTA